MAIDKPEKLQKLLNLAEEPAMAIMDELDTLNENLNKTEAIFASIPDISQLELIKGEKGDKGDKGEDGRDGLDGSPGINGLDGKDGRNGKDADESLIVHEVLLQIPTPKDGIDGKDGSPDSPQELRDKLETLKKDDRLDKKAIKGLEDLADKKDLDRAISILEQRTQFLINKPSSGTALTLTTTGSSGASTYDSSTGTLNIPQYSGSGASVWGSIAGTLSAQTDLQAALDLKAPLISPSLTTPSLGVATYTTLSGGDITLNNSTKHGEILVNSSYQMVFGHTYSAGNNVTQYDLKYYTGVYGTSGLLLDDVGNGYQTVLTQTGSGGLYIVQTNGTPGILTLGTRANPSDGSTFIASSGAWTISAGDLILTAGRLQAYKTTEQLRLGYDGSNYLSATVNSTGSITFDLVGTSPTFTFSKAVTATNFNGVVLTTAGVSTKFLAEDGVYRTPAGGSGITRSVNSISAPATAGATASTDYVYFVSGTTTLTLPTAVGNTNQYTVKNTGVTTVTIATTSAQTIDGSASVTLPVSNTSLTLISDNANWRIV